MRVLIEGLTFGDSKTWKHRAHFKHTPARASEGRKGLVQSIKSI